MRRSRPIIIGAIGASVQLLATAIGAYAQMFYVAPDGSDQKGCSNPSTPCATFQHAVDLCPFGGYCAISVAPGVYSQKTNVFYYKVISIVGHQDPIGQCIDRNAVVVDDRLDGIGQGGPIFSAQDHSVLTIRCMTLTAYARGSIGFATRQFAIGDVNEVNFLQFPEGYGVSANETSKISVYSPGIYGNSSRFALAADLSQVTLVGTIRIGDGLTFEVAFLSALFNSVVSVYPSAIVGGAGMSGASYQCVDALIKKNVLLPGGDLPYGGNDNCHIR